MATHQLAGTMPIREHRSNHAAVCGMAEKLDRMSLGQFEGLCRQVR